MPQFSDSDEKQFTSLGYLIRTAFNNYQTIISKYETLLVDNTTLNVLIKEKLSQLPIESEIERIINNLITEEDKKMMLQQGKLDTKETENKKTTDQLISSLDKTVRNLIFELRIVLGWLAIVSVVGVLATGYIKYATDSKTTKQTETIINSRPEQLRHGGILYWKDDNGIKHIIQSGDSSNFEIQQNHTAGVASGDSKTK
jgi:hypothetical protein